MQCNLRKHAAKLSPAALDAEVKPLTVFVLLVLVIL